MVRGPLSFAIAGVLSLAAVAAFVMGPSLYERVLPHKVSELISSVQDSGKPGPVRGDGSAPGDFLLDGPEGLVAKGPIAARAGNVPVFVRDVLSGHVTQVDADIPSEVTMIRPILGCNLTPPLPGSTVEHVVAGTSGIGTALATYDEVILAAEVERFADIYRATGQVSLPSPPTYEAYDVAVTETRAPVYLVLESLGGNRLWNLHLAEGARIERVVLLGGAQAGVANLDPVIPVEVILADGLAACGITPTYPLNPGHPVAQSAASGTGGAQAQLAAIAAAVTAYDDWFRASFGPVASQSRAGFDMGAVSVAGPVPADGSPKAVYAPLAGARIRTTQGQYFEIRGQSPPGEAFADRVRAIVTRFAFGDLDYLRQGVRF